MMDDLNATERENLHDLFMEFADDAGVLHETGFGRLMESIGHPMEADEVDTIFHEWQSTETGDMLSFENFLSMMCVYLKREAVEEQMELDFLKFAGLYRATPDTGDNDVPSAIDEICETLPERPDTLAVTAQGVIDVYERLGMDMPLSVAQDMVFNAASEQDDSLTIEDFIHEIRLVSRRELILDGERALRQTQLRRIRAASLGSRTFYGSGSSYGHPSSNIPPFTHISPSIEDASSPIDGRSIPLIDLEHGDLFSRRISGLVAHRLQQHSPTSTTTTMRTQLRRHNSNPAHIRNMLHSIREAGAQRRRNARTRPTVVVRETTL